MPLANALALGQDRTVPLNFNAYAGSRHFVKRAPRALEARSVRINGRSGRRSAVTTFPRVALVNSQRGDWLARRVGWLVDTTLGRLARTQQKYENVQDIRTSFFNCRKAMKRTALSGGANASTAYPAGKPDTKQKAFATQ